MSMVSLYLASRSLIEAPACQLSASLSRNIIRGTNQSSALTDFVRNTSEICAVDLPLGMGLGCTSNAESLAALAELRAWPYDLSVAKTLDELDYDPPLLQQWQEAERRMWRAAHCEQSKWQVHREPEGHGQICGYELCVGQDLPQGPTRSFNRFLTLVLREKMGKSAELESSSRELVQKLTDRPVDKLLWQIFPWKALIQLVSGLVRMDQGSMPILLKSWRVWEPRFLLGIAFLLASVQPLAELVNERRRLRHHKIPVVVHVGIDVIMLEITSTLVLTSSFIDELGNVVASGLDLVIRTMAGAVRGLDLSELKMKNIQNMQDVLLNAEGLEELVNIPLYLLQGLNKPLLVYTQLFVAFVAAALLFYYLSTILCKDNSECQRRPWVTRWSAAVGGPLHLLGCVEEPEVRKMCQPVRHQLLLRGFLVSAILGAFLVRSDRFDAVLSTALVFNSSVTGRLPWFLAWFALWALHIFSGMLAINGIEENQLSRDQKRKFKDMEAAYGATAQAKGPGTSPQFPERPPGLVPSAAAPAMPPGLPAPASASSSTLPPGLPQVSERPPAD